MAQTNQKPIPLPWVPLQQQQDDIAQIGGQHREPIPLTWAPLSNYNANGKNEIQKRTAAATGGDRSTVERDSKRRKVSGGNGNSRNTTSSNEFISGTSLEGTHNLSTDDDDDNRRAEEIQLLSNSSTLSMPGVPMAQSTPIVASSSRSAFSVLQQPLFTSASAHHPQHHFLPPLPPHGYFYPPPMDPIHQMFPPNPYNNPWIRWPSVGGMGLSQPGFFGMKMEPMETMNESAGQRAMTELNPRGPMENNEEKKKTKAVEIPIGNSNAKRQPQRDDSGMGQDETTLLSMEGGVASFEPISLPIPPQALFPPQGLFPTAMMHPINSYETYCTVPGRLTLLSNLKKYRVSIAEIQRRLAPPECLNASILGGILRKAKNKDGGRLLREQLLTYGVELTTGRRKQGHLTCFSSLVEEEAIQLARDFRLINQTNYPVSGASAFALADVRNAQDASMARLELYYASKFLNRILDYHKATQNPTPEQPKREPEQLDVSDPELQTGLTNFSLLTHGFGGLAVQSVLESMINVINESNAVLNRKYQATDRQMVPPPVPFNF